MWSSSSVLLFMGPFCRRKSNLMLWWELRMLSWNQLEARQFRVRSIWGNSWRIHFTSCSALCQKACTKTTHISLEFSWSQKTSKGAQVLVKMSTWLQLDAESRQFLTLRRVVSRKKNKTTTNGRRRLIGGISITGNNCGIQEGSVESWSTLPTDRKRAKQMKMATLLYRLHYYRSSGIQASHYWTP